MFSIKLYSLSQFCEVGLFLLVTAEAIRTKMYFVFFQQDQAFSLKKTMWIIFNTMKIQLFGQTFAQNKQTTQYCKATMLQ